MASGSRWLRISLDWSTSDWLIILSAESRLCWIEFLCYVKQVGTFGTVAKRHPLTLARRWGVGEESVTQMLRAAELHGAITTQDEQWVVAKWTHYQGNDAERMRLSRSTKTPKCDEVEPSVHERSGTFTNVQDVRVDTDTDTDTDITPPTPSRGKRVGFSSPSIEEVKAYGREIGLAFGECEAFWDYFTSNGWKVGNKAPMKDWKASLRNWKRSPYRNQRSGSLPRASEVALPT